MKTKIIIGEEEKKEIRFKEYASGMTVIESGDAENIIIGKKPIIKKNFQVEEKEKKEIFEKPEGIGISKGKLVRKVKKQ